VDAWSPAALVPESGDDTGGAISTGASTAISPAGVSLEGWASVALETSVAVVA
jgi:hypothetical protein